MAVATVVKAAVTETDGDIVGAIVDKLCVGWCVDTTVDGVDGKTVGSHETIDGWLDTAVKVTVATAVG